MLFKIKFSIHTVLSQSAQANTSEQKHILRKAKTRVRAKNPKRVYTNHNF